MLATGARCWFSVEVFDAGREGKGVVGEENFGEFCRGAMESHLRLLDECADSAD